MGWHVRAQMGLTWSDAPLAAAYSHPYVVALLPGHIEIRSVQDFAQEGLAQVLLPCPARNTCLHCHMHEIHCLSECSLKIRTTSFLCD